LILLPCPHLPFSTSILSVLYLHTIMQIVRRSPQAISSLNLPSAFSVQTSGVFDGDDGGMWSTFSLSVGVGTSGPQNFRVVVSTSSFSTWLPLPPGCPTNQSNVPPNCPWTRGVGLYINVQSTGYTGTSSSTAITAGIQWIDLGAQIDISTVIGSEYRVNGSLWLDYLSLSGSTASTPFRTSSNQAPIYGIDNYLYYLSTLGIGYGIVATNKTLQNSTLLSMASEGVIPSASWGYTAGAYYGKCSSDLFPLRKISKAVLIKDVFLLKKPSI
jgi:hypothetical protein